MDALMIAASEKLEEAYRERNSARQEAGDLRSALRAEQDRSDRLLEALTETWKVLRAAGLLNLSNGVQLGQTAWYVKACDAEALSDEAIRRATGDAQ